MIEFDFIADRQYRALLIRDYLELENCVKNEASKSVLILSGSIIETLLLEFFSHNLPNGINKIQLLKKNLSDLIDEAVKIGLISNKSKELSTVIKNYRNLIHPGREIRTNENFDQDTAIVSFSLVKIILKEIKQNYVEKYGYTGEDIFNKILVDNSTYSIFEKLIPKLNQHEKSKLLDLLVEYEIENYNSRDRGFHLHYIYQLKRFVEKDEIVDYCKRLLKEVEKGQKHTIFALYEIFGSNLNVLKDDEIAIILTYIYNKIDTIGGWNQAIEDNRLRKLFDNLGLYVENPELKPKFFDLIISLVRNHNYTKYSKWYYLSAYESTLSKLKDTEKEKVEPYVRSKVSSEIADTFYTELEDHNKLPF